MKYAEIITWLFIIQSSQLLQVLTVFPGTCETWGWRGLGSERRRWSVEAHMAWCPRTNSASSARGQRTWSCPLHLQSQSYWGGLLWISEPGAAEVWTTYSVVDVMTVMEQSCIRMSFTPCLMWRSSSDPKKITQITSLVAWLSNHDILGNAQLNTVPKTPMVESSGSLFKVTSQQFAAILQKIWTSIFTHTR